MGRAALAPISVRVDDSPGWTSLTDLPGDRPRSEVEADLESAMEAWRKNFLVRRIVTLTRAYTISGGITISSKDPQVQAFLDLFWDHPQNRLPRKLGGIANHLVLDGELFPILFTNQVDGISYVRWRTARQISDILTLPNDYETETAYQEKDGTLKGKTWISPNHPHAANPATPVMLHWHINRPFDALRGESDLTPILPWAKRTAEWLADRVRLNRQRTRTGIFDITVADDSQVEAVRERVRQNNPVEAGTYVHGSGEEGKMHDLKIGADDVEADGRALRMAVATGANISLPYLGEGEGTNYASAKEMGEPVARFYDERQQATIWMLFDLVEQAFYRYAIVKGITPPNDLQLTHTVAEVARTDNTTLAQAALSIAQACGLLAQQGWIDGETALSFVTKFAGETLTLDQIHAILAHAARHSERSEESKRSEESQPNKKD